MSSADEELVSRTLAAPTTDDVCVSEVVEVIKRGLFPQED